ncbi:MAG TPA: hypothetical protein VGA99_04290, partial [bacterium]
MHTKKSRWRAWPGATVFTIVLMTVATTFAQTTKSINWERMQRDLDIMEGVLSKLLLRSSHEWGPSGNNVNGVYFEDYGVVFQVEYDGLRIFTLSAKELQRSLHELQETTPQPDEEGEFVLAPEAPEVGRVTGVAEANAGKRVERMKSQTIEFLADYADAMGQLEDSDHITVVLDLGNSSGIQIFPRDRVRREPGKGISILEISALKADIIELRRGKLSGDEFRKRIQVNERSDDENMSRNIDIMSNILETALSRRHHEDYYLVGKNRGIYLKGLGTLFFLNAELSLGKFHVPEVEFGEAEDVVTVRTVKREARSKKSFEELLKNFEDTLVELFGDYGHTLRTLGPTEQVVAAVSFNNYWGLEDEAPRRFILKVKKEDLDTYNRGGMKLVEFK